MTDQQVLRYTQLCKRRMDILLHSGASWLPEYEAEHCTSLIYNVSTRSVKKLMENRRPDLLKLVQVSQLEE